MIDYQDTFHLGIRVPDLATAMDELGSSMGLTWSECRENREQALWTPGAGLQMIHLKYTYSAAGPQHIELLQGPPGTFWDGNDRVGAHHVGVWVDDVVAKTDALVAQGWALLGAHRDPGDGAGYGVFTYLQPPSGLIVELVDRVALPAFEQWWGAALT
ncbi:VOC family protein [Ilumatobacter sp.]|uniref:VOC family protein n=1 Tax=Ilumatobacter sp. TaxID=1967498 RepID=UPI0037535FC7